MMSNHQTQLEFPVVWVGFVWLINAEAKCPEKPISEIYEVMGNAAV